MTFGDGWALAGLLLLVPLVWLHLRARGHDARDVPSLLLWQELDTDRALGRRRLRPPARPLLLALQALGLVLLVVALANPSGTRRPLPNRVIVLDDSLWMQPPGRIHRGEQAVEQAVRGLPRDTPVAVVLASAPPTVLYRGDPPGVSAALARVRPSAAPADLSAALDDAAGLENGPRARLLLIRAPEDVVPPIRSNAGPLQVVSAGAPIADQGIFDPVARCGISAPGVCEVTATVRNAGHARVDDRLTATVAGRPSLSLSVSVGPDSSAPISLVALPGEQVALRLVAADPLGVDNRAWVIVPNAGNVPAPAVVTVVGTPSQAGAVARALASVPGVELQLRTPTTYRRADALDSSLVVFDDFVPPGGLPPSPGVLLIDAPRIPGGHVGRATSLTTLSGVDMRSPLLDEVDLSSLSINPGAARVVSLPPWLAPVAWSPSGPLLAAGDDGQQRLAVMSFDPADSDLPQLASFPILAANLVRWSLGWAPSAAVAGRPMQIDGVPGARVATLLRGGAVVGRASLARAPATLTPPEPGLYDIDEIGFGVSRHAAVAVSAGTTAPSSLLPVSIQPPRAASVSSPGPKWQFWLVGAALIVVAVEWVYWITRRPSAAR